MANRRKVLTEETKQSIVSDYEDGMKVLDIARKHDVSINSIYRWVNKEKEGK